MSTFAPCDGNHAWILHSPANVLLKHLSVYDNNEKNNNNNETTTTTCHYDDDDDDDNNNNDDNDDNNNISLLLDLCYGRKEKKIITIFRSFKTSTNSCAEILLTFGEDVEYADIIKKLLLTTVITHQSAKSYHAVKLSYPSI